MRCTKCRQKVYCSKACQVAGWKGGHKQECERLREGGGEGVGSGVAALQEALRAALQGTTGRARQRQHLVFQMMCEAFNAREYRQVVQMEEEGLAVMRELRRAWPDLAAQIYRMLGFSLSPVL